MQIQIYFSRAKSANSELKTVISRIDTLKADLDRLQRRLDPEIRSRHQINATLTACRNAASTAGARARKLYNAVDGGVQRYQSAESRLNRGGPNNDIVRR